MRTPACVLMVGLVLVGGPSVAACGGERDEGPTVVQAEQALKSHVDQLLKATIVRDVQVTDPGGKNMPCVKNKVKRTYAVNADKRDAPALDQVGLTGRMLGLLKGIAEYDLTYAKGGDPTMKLHSPEARTNLILKSPSKGKIRIEGVTDCLDRK
jgi:hypothetical protein